MLHAVKDRLGSSLGLKRPEGARAMTASLSWLLLRVACSVGMPGAFSTALLDGLPAIFLPSTMKPVTETVIFAGLSEVSAAHRSQRQARAATQGQEGLGYPGLAWWWAARQMCPT